MRYIRYAFLAALAVVLITVALANREIVTLRLLPAELSGFLGWSWSVNLPLFIVIFMGVIAGVLIGFIWEWLREHKLRAEGRRAKTAAVKLATEVQDLKRQQAKPEDEVLALLEPPR
ncbi:LapA family protein [Maritimibacter sp. DP1N21-5]|uniref:LapA family protein n=1 Tax=Maritimibacter sp. DP1N21-5 TaxID=2836867 RepID=UPI001C459A3D|nr:LapA family protein [Maritimibacter sp. DP1N21-5]MBV7408643.1 LapA family protein [Maritimibacter sp. DP1N21-5]